MGALNRRIEIVTRAGEARAVVEDDYHHFRVTIRHEDGVVREAFSETLRFPNLNCPLAGERLSELVGLKLDPSSIATHAYADARQQCTHMFDIAGLAVAAAARGDARRTYEATMPDRVDGRSRPTLKRDGVEVLAWDVNGPIIEGPEPYAGRNIGAGFTGFAATLPLEEAEAALVLRRAVFISVGREKNLDEPDPSYAGPIGGCWSWQPERKDRAIRVKGSTLDFTGKADVLTRDDKAWLAFAD